MSSDMLVGAATTGAAVKGTMKIFKLLPILFVGAVIYTVMGKVGIIDDGKVDKNKQIIEVQKLFANEGSNFSMGEGSKLFDSNEDGKVDDISSIIVNPLIKEYKIINTSNIYCGEDGYDLGITQELNDDINLFYCEGGKKLKKTISLNVK